MLLQGMVGRMIGGLKQRLTKNEMSNAARHSLKQVIGYLDRNRKHMVYEIFLAKGYPMASRVIEGLAESSLTTGWNPTGMGWTIHGGKSVMRLRSVQTTNKD
jgi:hypothetical protein